MTEERQRIASFGVSFGGEAHSGGEREGDSPPFRIVVLAELVARPEWSTGRTPSSDPISIDTESFDRVMGELATSLAVDVDDPFGVDEQPLRIDLVWRDRKSMRPDAIVEQVPAVRALAEASRIVEEVAARRRTVDDAYAHLARILPRVSWAEALVREVRTLPVAVSTPTAPQGSALSPPAVRAEERHSSDDGLSALLDMVDFTRTREAATVPPAEGKTSRLVETIVQNARRRADTLPTMVGTAPERLELAFRNLLESILRHPEVRRLEATWRGLWLLVEHCDKRSAVEVDVVCAGHDQVADALGRLQSEARTPVDLVVIDRRLEPTAVDLARLETWAALAQELLAPIVVGGHPLMLGVDSLARVARSTSALSTSDDPRAVATRATASREATRWVAVVLNDPLVRGPYTVSTSRQREPPFQEEPDDGEANVFASAGYVVAALCARSHARLHWPTAITGARDGVLGNLAIHTVRDRGHEAAIPLEVVPSDDALRDVARAGITMLACAPNTDAAVLLRAPTLHRPGGGSGAPASTLSDQLFVGRVARAVRQTASAIPTGTDPRAAEEVARISLAGMFVNAAPPGPDVIARVDPSRNALTVTVRPRRYAGVGLEEMTVGASLG